VATLSLRRPHLPGLHEAVWRPGGPLGRAAVRCRRPGR